MITLSKKEQTEKANQIAKHPHKFMVLDVEHIKYAYNTEKFKLAVEYLNFCNKLTWVNEILENTGSDSKIELSILFEAIQHILSDKPFSKGQLKTYYATKRQFEKISFILDNFTDLSENMYFPEVDLILLGVSLKTQKKLIEEEIDLINEYSDMHDKALQLDSLDEVLTRINETINKSLKAA